MIEKRTLDNGRKQYRVQWRDGGRGSRQHVKCFDRHEDAVRFETETRRRKQLGELAVYEAGKVTLDEFAREWWKRYASVELARKTQKNYASLWDLHVLPRATLVGGAGFSYQIATIKREGIKTVKGKPLAND